MAYVVKTKRGNKIEVSPVCSGNADKARGDYKRELTRNEIAYTGGNIIRLMRDGEMISMTWVEV